MSPTPWRKEFTAIRRRTRRMVAVSLVLHVLAFFLWPRPESGAAEERVLEIVWLEEPEPVAIADAAPPPAPETRRDREGDPRKVHDAKRDERVRFERTRAKAPEKPVPQKRDAARDLVRERLASLEPRPLDRRTQIARALTTPPQGRSPAPPPPATNVMPRELVRSAEPPAKKPLERSAPPPNRTPAIAPLLASPEPAPAKPLHDDPSMVREVLAGVSLSGPVADRPLLSYRRPNYPEDAKREAIEGSVRLRFFVLPDGGVKENVLVERTSGFGEFDHNAKLAILDWRFEALPSGATGEQWGTIILNYRLADAR